MPYPVSPPALPPVVDLAPATQPPLQSPAASRQAGSEAVEGCPSGVCAAEPLAPSSNRAEPEVAISSAAPLGQPIAIGQTSSQPNPLNGESASAHPPAATFLQLPDLDSLQRAQFSRRRPRPDARTIPTSQVAASQTTSPAARPSQPAALPFQPLQSASPGAADRPSSRVSSPPQIPLLPHRQPEGPSVNRQLAQASPPVSPSGNSSGTPSIDQPPGLPESLPLDLSEPVPSLPQPAPEPDGGQILTIPTPQPEAAPAPVAPDGAAVPIDPQAVGEVVEVRGDRQEFDERRQIFRAEGNVEVRFRRGVLTADQVQVNLLNRLAVAEGNAVLLRGNQVLRGERFEYSFGLNQGNIQTARGDLLLPATQRDFNLDAAQQDFDATVLSTGVGRIVIQPVTSVVETQQPVQGVFGRPGPIFGVGNRPNSQSQINRFRFEADRAEFDGSTVVADNVRITNDPFSPPELELRSNRVTYRRLSPFQAEIVARNPRLVFDNGFTLPLLVNRLVLDNRERDPGFFSFGFDERDRDGFFVERLFNVYSSPVFNFSVRPQLLIQRAIDQGGFPTDLDNYGLVANADFQFTRDTTAQAIFNLSSLNLDNIDDSLRASLRAQQRVLNHTVALEYSYRNRLFNGSLGFQDIHSSVGLVVTSPRYVLGNSLINLTYQGSLQYINAQTDQIDLYNFGLPNRDLSCIDPEDRSITGNGCADLTRYQAAVTLSRFFPLWTGTALPATPTEGLRYSPFPVTPYLGVSLEARGVYSGYSNGDHQAFLRGGATLLGQFGRFSRPLFDYTAFSVGYFNTALDGSSPFLFDRLADEQVLIASLTQQIYGPLRFGVQVSYNLTTGDDIDAVYTLEYSRRTYTISANYSTGRRQAALTFRLNDFNWTGDAGPFSGGGSADQVNVETTN